VTLLNVKTVLTRSPNEAAEFIRRGGLVAFPTETVYGLGANVFNEAAVERIFEAKNRPPDNPLIAHIAERSQIESLAATIMPSAEKLVHAFFPGPLTVVLPKHHDVPLIATAGLDSVGIRMPGNTVAREFLSLCGTPVVAPSANLSGRPSPTTWTAVYEDLNGRIDCILQSDDTEIGLESTVVDCTSEPPVLLRKGAVSIDELRSIIPSIEALESDDVVSARRSPGLRHKHYAPKALIVLVEMGNKFNTNSTAAFIGLHEPKGDLKVVKVCGSVDEYAHSLFEFFRECDRRGIQTIFCETVAEDGIGAALMDRLRRAAE
jgi:L-threonylcarbamoyladenylate synthase